MRTPNIGISATNLKKINTLLNNVLADGNIIYIKLRKFHWNLNGPDFMQFHKLFEEQYTLIEQAIDDVAERISTLGGIAIGTSSEFAKYSSLKEQPTKNPTPDAMVIELLDDHELIVRSLRDTIDKCEDTYKDKGTADMLTELMQSHEKMAWQLRQYFKS